MGDGEKASLRLQFNPKVRLAFHGATITTDAGLLAFREFDDALGLTEIAEDYLQESRTGRNILHHLVPLLRQSIYSRLVLQRRFKEGCAGRHEVRRGAWHGSAWPVRYYPASLPATAATQPARTVPWAAIPAPPGRPAAS